MEIYRTVDGILPMTIPTAGWVFDYVLPAIWTAILGYILFAFFKTKRFSDLALIFLSATAGFWVEWFADWGTYLLYNPRLLLMPWESQWFMTPYKPWAVIFGYGIFFSLGVPFAQWVASRIQRMRPAMSRNLVLLLASTPTFYIFDVAAESLMTFLGWYSYTQPVPPALHFEKGSFSLVQPALLFCLWSYLWIYLIDRPQPNMVNRLEALAGPKGPKSEIGRLFLWCIAFSVTLFLLQGLDTVILRILFGGPSDLVP